MKIENITQGQVVINQPSLPTITLKKGESHKFETDKIWQSYKKAVLDVEKAKFVKLINEPYGSNKPAKAAPEPKAVEPKKEEAKPAKKEKSKKKKLDK